jgi:hypothetical protein
MIAVGKKLMMSLMSGMITCRISINDEKNSGMGLSPFLDATQKACAVHMPEA